MKVYRKVTMYVMQEIPDNLTEEKQEEFIDEFNTGLNLDLDNLQDGGNSNYSWEYETDEVTREELEEENSMLLHWLERGK